MLRVLARGVAGVRTASATASARRMGGPAATRSVHARPTFGATAAACSGPAAARPAGPNPSRTDHRTHTCGELRRADCGETVRLSGWVQNTRKLGGILFLALRDQYGITQLRVGGDSTGGGDDGGENGAKDGVKDGAKDGEDFFDGLRPETIISVQGVVVARPDDAVNANMTGGTGEIEVEIAGATSLTVLNSVDFSNMALQPQQLLFRTSGSGGANTSKSKKGAGKNKKNRKKSKNKNRNNATDDVNSVAGEELRLRYRHLDLRRAEMQRNLRLRSNVTLSARTHLSSLGFTEVETPILFKSTPEGAREFLVPTRRRSEFYALPQSPQQHKQLLMCGGVDRYFQVARCFRDEGGRADRQPEFTQLDMEMSFVGAEDIMSTVESTVAVMMDAAHVSMEEFHANAGGIPGACAPFPRGNSIRGGLPRMRFADAMTRFGSDKPDVRYGLEIRDVTSTLLSTRGAGVDASRRSNNHDAASGDRDVALPAGFQRAISAGSSVRAVRVPRLGGELSRKEIAALGERVANFIGGDVSSEQVIVAALKPPPEESITKGDEDDERGSIRPPLRWVSSSPSMRFLGEHHSRLLALELDAREGDLVALVGDPVSTEQRDEKPPPSFWRGCEALGKFRAECAELLADLGDDHQESGESGFDYDFKDKWSMMWVVDFPLFEEESDASYVQSALKDGGGKSGKNMQHNRPLASSHHPFTAPHPEDARLVLDFDVSTEVGVESLLKVRGQHYDLVCNGVELGGGSIRIHDKHMQTRIFSDVLGLSTPMQESFKHLTDALGHGCPPHGGALFVFSFFRFRFRFFFFFRVLCFLGSFLSSYASFLHGVLFLSLVFFHAFPPFNGSRFEQELLLV
jgi:aspartyl-tRNA synthetase